MKRRFFLFAAPAIITVSQVMPISSVCAELWKPQHIEALSPLYDHPRSTLLDALSERVGRTTVKVGYLPQDMPADVARRWYGDNAEEMRARMLDHRLSGKFQPPPTSTPFATYRSNLKAYVGKDFDPKSIEDHNWRAPVTDHVPPSPDGHVNADLVRAGNEWHASQPNVAELLAQALKLARAA